MSFALHAVEVSKKNELDDARRISQEFIKDKKKNFYRDSKNFYRFRNISKQKFIPKSFKSKKINNDVVLIYGELKPEFSKLTGAGFMDFLKNPIGHIKEAFRGVPSKLNNISTKTLNDFGNLPIIAIQIARTPLNNMLEGAINSISLGKFSELKKQNGFDKLYHLSLIATVNNQEKVIVEKNETITIEPLKQSSSIKSNTEYLQIPLTNNNLTLNIMIDKTRQHMGDTKFYDYDSFTNNCQNFIENILISNNLYNDTAKSFLMQDVTNIKEGLDNSKFSYVPKIMRKITNFGSIVSRLTGKGTKKKALDGFDNYMNKYNLNEEDETNMMYHFINYINTEGIRFL